jgi:hypothetical protein
MAMLRRGLAVGWLLAVAAALFAAVEPCRIDIVEHGSGWPVPLVELRTTHGARFVSDNAGIVAFDLPECLGRETWLFVEGHGYGVPADGFGFRGVRVTPRSGARLKIEVTRSNLARRLGRITGGGIFGESQKLGLEPAWRESGVFGCDSVQAVEYHGRLFWMWGDTTLARYPLGVFHMTAARTEVRPLQPQPAPPIRLNYELFRDAEGQPRPVATMSGEGPTWLAGLIVLPDAKGRDHLVAAFAKIKPPLTAYETGLCAWDDQLERFAPVAVRWRAGAGQGGEKPPLMPDGHAVIAGDAEGRRWVYFGNPLPTLRCPATFEAWSDPSCWEALPAPKQLPIAGSDALVTPHGGSIAWHPWRQKWVTIFTQWGGKGSLLGEIWYAEAPSPTGPWGPAVKVLTHENYTFYNPRIHAAWLREDSPVLIFEGTFTKEFADRPPAVARFDYNQVLYRLDLDDAAFAPAQVR